MKTAYTISSSIVVILLCLSMVGAEAQSIPTFTIPTFEEMSSRMGTITNPLPMGAIAQSSKLPGYSMSKPYSSLFNFGTTPSTTTPVTQANASKIDMSSFSMPLVDMSAFSSQNIMPMLLSDSVTQTNVGTQPNSTNNYTLADNGSTIGMKVNDTIYIQLPFHINAGGVWNITVSPGLNVSNQRTHTPLINPSSAMSGGIDLSAIQEFDVVAIAPGAQTIKGTCQGSNQTFVLYVNVS